MFSLSVLSADGAVLLELTGYDLPAILGWFAAACEV